jgi:hypothetical protein
MSLAEYFTN